MLSMLRILSGSSIAHSTPLKKAKLNEGMVEVPFLLFIGQVVGFMKGSRAGILNEWPH